MNAPRKYKNSAIGKDLHVFKMTLNIFVCKTYLLVKKAFVLKSETHVYSFNFISSVNFNVQWGKITKQYQWNVIFVFLLNFYSIDYF